MAEDPAPEQVHQTVHQTIGLGRVEEWAQVIYQHGGGIATVPWQYLADASKDLWRTRARAVIAIADTELRAFLVEAIRIIDTGGDADELRDIFHELRRGKF